MACAAAGKFRSECKELIPTLESGSVGGDPLDDDEIDIAVFSLSLMGHNNGNYLREAARVLAYDGRSHIVEAASLLDKVDDIEDRLGRLGFKLIDLNRIDEPNSCTSPQGELTKNPTSRQSDLATLAAGSFIANVGSGSLSVQAAAVQSVAERLRLIGRSDRCTTSAQRSPQNRRMRSLPKQEPHCSEWSLGELNS